MFSYKFSTLTPSVPEKLPLFVLQSQRNQLFGDERCKYSPRHCGAMTVMHTVHGAERPTPHAHFSLSYTKDLTWVGSCYVMAFRPSTFQNHRGKKKKKPACSLVGSGNLKKKKSHSTLKIKNKSSHIGISHTTAPKEVNSTVVLHQRIGKKMKEE